MSRSRLTTICNWNPAGPGRLPSPAAGPGRRRSGRSAARPRARPAPPRPGGPARAPSLGHPEGHRVCSSAQARIQQQEDANSAAGRMAGRAAARRPPHVSARSQCSFGNRTGRTQLTHTKVRKPYVFPPPRSDCPVPSALFRLPCSEKATDGDYSNTGPFGQKTTAGNAAQRRDPRPGHGEPAYGRHPANGQNQTRPQATAATRPTARNHNQRVRHAGGSGGSPPRTSTADHREGGRRPPNSTSCRIASRGRGGI